MNTRIWTKDTPRYFGDYKMAKQSQVQSIHASPFSIFFQAPLQRCLELLPCFYPQLCSQPRRTPRLNAVWNGPLMTCPRRHKSEKGRISFVGFTKLVPILHVRYLMNSNQHCSTWYFQYQLLSQCSRPHFPIYLEGWDFPPQIGYISFFSYSKRNENWRNLNIDGAK